MSSIDQDTTIKTKKETAMSKIKAIDSSLSTVKSTKRGFLAAFRMASVIVPAALGFYVLAQYRADIVLIIIGVALVLFALYNLAVISWRAGESK